MADKKGDIIDGLLFFGQNGSDPIQFSDYPETVIGTLRLFYNIWKVPSYVIPSKKSKSKFEDWINQLDDLNGICPNGEKMSRAMQMAKDYYDNLSNQFMIVRPSSIRNLLINSVRKINDEEEKLRKLEEENKKKEVVDTQKEIVSSNRFKKLRWIGEALSYGSSI